MPIQQPRHSHVGAAECFNIKKSRGYSKKIKQMFDFNKKTCIIEGVGILILKKPPFCIVCLKMPNYRPVISFFNPCGEETKIRADQ